MKVKPITIGLAAVALGGGLWLLSAQRRGIMGVTGSPAPADLYEPTLNTAVLPSGFEFPPLPNTVFNLGDDGCCKACNPARRMTTVAPSEMPVVAEASLASPMPAIPNTAPPASMSSHAAPQAIMGPGLYGYSKPQPQYATQQTAPYLTEIAIAPNGTTARGFNGSNDRERAFA